MTCNFEHFVDSDGKVHNLQEEFRGTGTALSYAINLDGADVVVSCATNESCILDGHSIKHHLRTPITAKMGFSKKDETIRTLSIEGGNGDDMDMFTRISFEAGTAKAVLIYADEGNDGWVSAPTNCSVSL